MSAGTTSPGNLVSRGFAAKMTASASEIAAQALSALRRCTGGHNEHHRPSFG